MAGGKEQDGIPVTGIVTSVEVVGSDPGGRFVKPPKRDDGSTPREMAALLERNQAQLQLLEIHKALGIEEDTEHALAISAIVDLKTRLIIHVNEGIEIRDALGIGHSAEHEDVLNEINRRSETEGEGDDE